MILIYSILYAYHGAMLVYYTIWDKIYTWQIQRMQRKIEAIDQELALLE